MSLEVSALVLGPSTLGRFVWYNLNNGVVTTSRFDFAGGGQRFGALACCLYRPFILRIRLYPVENVETGEGVDSKKRQ